MTNERYDQLVLEAQAKIVDYTEFAGQNCDGPCLGWDGHSRRCECGNRRVSWEPYGDEIYAEAW